MIDEYHKQLEANGFSGSDQIMRKTVSAREHIVDFSFAVPGDSDCEIQYLISK